MGGHSYWRRERTMASNGDRYNVGGVLLPRPFKIRRLGHFGFNAVKMDASRDFYGALLGFKHSDILDFGKMPWRPRGPTSATRVATSCATERTTTRSCSSTSG